MTVQELQLYVDTVIAALTNPFYRSCYEALLRIHRTEFHSSIHDIDHAVSAVAPMVSSTIRDSVEKH